MNKIIRAIIGLCVFYVLFSVFFLVAFGGSPTTAGTIQATATFSNFFNGGVVTNTSSDVVSLTKAVLGLGTPQGGIGTWDSAGGAAIPAGGTASDFLSNPNFFQTITFDGLSLSPGNSFSWSGLDFDLISSLSPLAVSSGPLCTPGGCSVDTALNNASFTVYFGDGNSVVSGFASGNIALDQTLTLVVPGASEHAPEPATLVLLGLGLVAMGAMRRSRAA